MAAPAIEGLTQLWRDVFERIRNDVGQWEESPRLVGVFGSAARRDGGEESDIDLLVVSDVPDEAGGAAELAARVERWTGNPTRVITVGSKDLRRMRRAREPVLGAWERDLVVIVGDVAL